MPDPQLSVVMQLAGRVDGPPYDPEGAQELCDLLERMLQAELEADGSWSKWDWLDGFIAQWLERQSTWSSFGAASG